MLGLNLFVAFAWLTLFEKYNVYISILRIHIFIHTHTLTLTHTWSTTSPSLPCIRTLTLSYFSLSLTPYVHTQVHTGTLTYTFLSLSLYSLPISISLSSPLYLSPLSPLLSPSSPSHLPFLSPSLLPSLSLPFSPPPSLLPFLSPSLPFCPPYPIFLTYTLFFDTSIPLLFYLFLHSSLLLSLSLHLPLIILPKYACISINTAIVLLCIGLLC